VTLVPAVGIVLAGGEGTRLRTVLPDVPKVLAPVGGRPFLRMLLDTLASRGLRRVVLATGYAAESIENEAHASRGELEIRISREERPLGTGGAIAQAFDLVDGPRAWVFNGDSFCDVDLSRVAALAEAAPDDPWLVATEVEDASRFGTLVIEGSHVSRFREKTGTHERGWINAGIYLLPRGLMAKQASSIERDWFPAWAAQGRLRVAPLGGRFIDIGTPESLVAAESFFR
jgi:D-glycero-alpha-D-manno-heptose 1-phosphate guanylyltransferase